MSLASVLQTLFGVRTRAEINPLVSSIGTSAVQVLPNDPDRLAYSVVNLSSNIIYVGLDSSVSSSRGIRLDANGGECSMLFDEDFQTTGYELWAVSAGAASAIYVLAVKEY